jgi:hypothetical protein
MKQALLLATVTLILAITLAISVAAEQSTPASQPPPDLSLDKTRIVALDKKILTQFLAIERFNLHFQQNTNRHQWWRLWIYPIAQTSGTAACLSNTLVGLSQRARGLSDPDLISDPSRKRGLSANVVGKTVNGTSSAFEFTQNGLVFWRAREMGFSPGRSVLFMKSALAGVDELLDERTAIVEKEPPGRTHDIRLLEGRLLVQIRDQMVFEFRKWSAHSRETAWKENTFYAIDALQNYLAATGSVLALKGFTSPPARGAAVLTTLVANSMSAVNPIIRTQAGYLALHYQRHKLDKDFPRVRPQLTKTIMPTWADLDSLRSEDLWPTSDTRSLAEVAFLSQNSEKFDDVLSHQVDAIQKLRRVANQQEISGPLIGLAGVSRSVLETVAHYGYQSDRVTANRINFAGAIPQAAGQSYAVLNTPVTQIAGYIHYRRLARQNQTPEQILQARLNRLDKLEAEFRSW